MKRRAGPPRVCGFPQPRMVTGRILVRGSPRELAGRLAFFEKGFWRILAVEMLEPKGRIENGWNDNQEEC